MPHPRTESSETCLGCTTSQMRKYNHLQGTLVYHYLGFGGLGTVGDDYTIQ